MTAGDYWQEVERLFHAALELEPEGRREFLAESCGGDGELLAEVQSLIAAHEQPDTFIDSPAMEITVEVPSGHYIESKVGRTVGHYLITAHIGKGGMGAVYLAEDLSLGRKVALKMLAPQYSADRERLRRFLQEAIAASALNHPNIITIYEVGQSADAPFIAIEYIEGHTLRSHIPKISERLTEVLEVALQVASALAAAHAAGIIHRDIKPENIMIRPDGLVKVLDFGIAKLTRQLTPTRPQAPTDNDAETIINETEPGMVMGTARYMSPEQARGTGVDTRTDIFSFGIVLYEMIAGGLPFEGKTASDVMAAILRAEPVPLSRRANSVPALLEAVVTRALQKQPQARYQSISELIVDLKSIRRDLEIDAVLGRTIGLDPRASEAAGPSPRRRPRRSIDSLAVLPLANAGNDPETDYLSDGITESLINNLSQLPKLRVMARSTVFRYKGRDVDPQEIGHKLGINAVLVGRVLQRADKLVIKVELVDVTDGTRLWGGQYNRNLTDILSVEEELASEISEQLRLKLSTGEKKLLQKRYTENTEAYHLYLKGRYYWNKRNAEGYKKSIEYFQQAIDIDPTYALAYAGLSDSYNLLGQYLLLPVAEAFPKAKQAAAAALDLDEKLAEAHTAQASIKLYYDWDWSAAEQEFLRSIDLNPNYATTHQRYAEYLMYSGDHRKALLEIRRAQELDPLSLSINASVGWMHYNAGETGLAIEQLRKTVELDQNFIPVHFFLGQAYEQEGRFEQAIAELGKAVELSGRSPTILALLGRGYAVAGRTDEAREVLEELKALASQRLDSAYYIATIYEALGERDQALGWLEKASDEREPVAVHMKVDPRLTSLRSEPRFQRLLERIGFP